MSTFKLSDTMDFKKYKDISKTQKNRRNKKRRRERKKEWKASNPKPERRTVENVTPEKEENPVNVSDVLKSISAKRKAVRR